VRIALPMYVSSHDVDVTDTAAAPAAVIGHDAYPSTAPDAVGWQKTSVGIHTRTHRKTGRDRHTNIGQVLARSRARRTRARTGTAADGGGGPLAREEACAANDASPARLAICALHKGACNNAAWPNRVVVLVVVGAQQL
jgi:hypothetical protein